jgi:hypothetical protein
MAESLKTRDLARVARATHCAAEKNSRWGGGRDDDAASEPLPRDLRRLEGRPAGVLGRGGAGDRLVRAARDRVRREGGRLRPLVRRRRLQCLPQRARPPCRHPRRPARADLRQRHDRREGDLYLRRDARRGRRARRRPARDGRGEGRPRRRLHADDPAGGVRHARLRAARRRAFGGVRRLRGEGARHPHRGRAAEGDPLRLLRARARPRRRLQAAPRPRHRALHAQAPGLPDLPAAAGRGRARRGPRPRLGAGRRVRQGAGPAGRLRSRGRDRSALCALHLGHDRQAQGRGARYGRLHGRAGLVDARALRHEAGRGLLVRLGCRLGGGPFLHRLRPADRRMHVDPLRGQAGGHAGRGRLLARDRGARRDDAVHGADRLARHQEGRPERRAPEATTISRRSARSSSPASAPTPPRCNGRRISCRSR